MFEIAHPTAGLPQSHYCRQHQRNVPETTCPFIPTTPQNPPTRFALVLSNMVWRPIVTIWGYPTTNYPPQDMGGNPVLSTQQTHVNNLLLVMGDPDSVVISPPSPIRIFFRYWPRRDKIKTPAHHKIYDAYGWASKSFLGLRTGRTQLTRKRKHRLFRDRRHLLHRGEPALGQPLQHPIHQDFRH